MSTVVAARPDAGVVQVLAEVVANRPAGDYRHLVLTVPGAAALARPGQFVALAVGGPTSSTLLRRSFSIHAATPGGARSDAGEVSDTVEVVVAAHGAGTRWITALRPGEEVDVVGPLGRPFPLPTEPVPAVLVGGGYGSAPLGWLASALAGRGCPVEVVLGAATADRLFGVDGIAELAPVTVTTEDGTAGVPGRVTDVLPDVVARTGALAVYACGPMGMLEAVTAVAADHGAAAQVAVEESMACGIGICMTCVLPVRGRDGGTRMLRSCVDGPVFRGDRVRWDAFERGYGRVPEDAVGAPLTSGRPGEVG